MVIQPLEHVKVKYCLYMALAFIVVAINVKRNIHVTAKVVDKHIQVCESGT